MASTKTTKEVAVDLLPMLRVYTDGSLERADISPYVPPSPEGDPQTGVSTKDVVISDNPALSARIFHPTLTMKYHKKLPILVYFHGGAFVVGSMFTYMENRYLTDLVSRAACIAVCVEYRLAPEHPLPAAYEDCWTSLQWVASHSGDNPIKPEQLLIDHGDFDRVYLGGDSAGGNIVHNIALRAGMERLNCDVKIVGAFLACPYFCGSTPVGSEPVEEHEQCLGYRVWKFVFPSAMDGIDNPMINPTVEKAPSLAGLGCSKLLVCIAGKDFLRERGVWYYEAVKKSGWEGELELFEIEDEVHCFHCDPVETENSKRMKTRLAAFIQ